jgi:DNA-binding beta-propeller fold protein YncE
MSRIPINRWNGALTKLSLACCCLAFAFSAQAQAPVTAGAPIAITGTKGKFDFMRIDTGMNRLLLAHEENKSFDVFDLKNKKLVKVVATGTSQDAAVDVKREKYYVAGNDPARLVIVDRKTLAVDGELPMPKDVDLIAYDPANGLVYLCNDTAAQIWVIDPAAKKVVTTIDMQGGGAEDLVFEPGYKYLYQAIKKGSDGIVRIDTATNKVVDAWPLAPETGPHGIALVPESKGLLVACEGKLVLMDRTNGKILDKCDIAKRVDEVAYDPGNHLAYCAGKFGKLSVVKVEGDKLNFLGDASDEQDATSVVVDPKTHTAWVGYAKGKGGQTFVQPFTPAQ